jgi:hypothetical protein
MPEPTTLEIIRRAFELWQRAGCPEGRDKEFCRQAEQELRNENKPHQSPPDKHET